MRIDKPVSKIKRQTQTNTSAITDSTLVDDSVRLVDDPASLVGAGTTSFTGMRLNARPDIPAGRITKTVPRGTVVE